MLPRHNEGYSAVYINIKCVHEMSGAAVDLETDNIKHLWNDSAHQRYIFRYKDVKRQCREPSKDNRFIARPDAL